MDAPLLPTPWQTLLGQQVRALRLARNLSQSELAQQAGVALGALKRLETGQGATLRTLTEVTLALDRSAWLQSLHPLPGLNTHQSSPAPRTPQRLRAGKPRKAPGAQDKASPAALPELHQTTGTPDE